MPDTPRGTPISRALNTLGITAVATTALYLLTGTLYWALNLAPSPFSSPLAPLAHLATPGLFAIQLANNLATRHAQNTTHTHTH